MTEGYTLVGNVPEIDDYLGLRAGAGLSRRSMAAAALAAQIGASRSRQ